MEEESQRLKNNEMKMAQWPEGIKKTRQREAVYQILVNAKEPLSAMDIYHLMEQNHTGGNYAISTVYRALAVFEEKGLIIKSTLMGDDMSLYTWNHGVHRHYAICLKCHKLVPLKACPFEQVDMNTGDDDFQITGHKIELYGYCRQCKLE